MDCRTLQNCHRVGKLAERGDLMTSTVLCGGCMRKLNLTQSNQTGLAHRRGALGVSAVETTCCCP